MRDVERLALIPCASNAASEFAFVFDFDHELGHAQPRLLPLRTLDEDETAAHAATALRRSTLCAATRCGSQERQ